MTIAEAWDVLDAASEIGRAHGYECEPVIGRGVLLLDFWRGGRRVMSVVLAEADANACVDAAAVRGLIELRVAEAFALHGLARRAIA